MTGDERRRATRRTRAGRAFQALVLLVFATTSAGFLLVHARTGRVDESFAGPVLTLFSVIAVVAACRVAALRQLPLRTRRAWRFVAGGYALLTVAGLAFAAIPSAFPGPSDGLRLAAVLPLLAGLLTITEAPRSPVDRARLALDIGIVVAGGFMALWYFSLGPLTLLSGAPVFRVVAALAFPVLDVVLLFGASTALMRGAARSSRRPLVVLVAGLATLMVADLPYAGAAVSGVDPFDSVPQWMLLLTAYALMAYALMACAPLEAVVRGSEVSPPSASRQTSASVAALPLVAIAGGYSLLLVVAGRSGLYPWGGLVAGAVVMTGLVVVRQVPGLNSP